MNVLMILTNGFDPDLRVYKEAKYLINNGHNVEILCWDRENKYIDKPTEMIDRIKITRFYEKSIYGSGLKQVFSLIKFKRQCKTYINNNNIKPNFLHCHDLDGMLVGYLLHIKNSKLVFDMHEYYNTGSYAKIYFIVKKLINFLQNKAFKIIHVNEQQTKRIKKKNKNKLIYVPNYPETNKFLNIKHINDNKLRITYAGYVRHLVPLTNLAKAVNELDNISANIHGIGNKYSEIKRLENKYKNFKVFGKYNYDEIVKFYSNTDLMYIVYDQGNINSETALPTKFFEAIACKIPIIVSKNSLLEEMVKKYDIGFVVDGNDYKSIKHILEIIQTNKNLLQEKIENIKKIPEKFSWEEIVKNLNKIYENK